MLLSIHFIVEEVSVMDSLRVVSFLHCSPSAILLFELLSAQLRKWLAKSHMRSYTLGIEELNFLLI